MKTKRIHKLLNQQQVLESVEFGLQSNCRLDKRFSDLTFNDDWQRVTCKLCLRSKPATFKAIFIQAEGDAAVKTALDMVSHGLG